MKLTINLARAAAVIAIAASSTACSTTDPYLQEFYANVLPPEAHGTKAPDPRLQAGPGLGPDRVYVVHRGRTIATLPGPSGSGGQFVYTGGLR